MQLYKIYLIVLPFLIFCSCGRCIKPTSENVEELVKEYLVQPVISNDWDYDGNRQLTFTNNSECYRIEITMVGYSVKGILDSDYRTSSANIYLVLPPKSTGTVEVNLGIATKVGSVYSLLSHTHFSID